MEGVEHAPFNAALLHAVSIAYPAARLSFRAVPSHLEAVQEILSQHAPNLGLRITWQELPLARRRSLAMRLAFYQRMLRTVLAPGQRTLFCSISRLQLIQLKRMMTRRDCGIVRTVMHGEIELLADRPGGSRRPFSLHRALLKDNPAGLRYLLLGQAIFDNIPPLYRQAFEDAGVFDHPYHFATPTPAMEGPPVFGIFGNSGDGSMLESIARSIRSTDPSVRFRLIGFLEPSAVERLRHLVEDVGSMAVPRQTFIERAQGITHALWLAPANGFRLRASGTFFDALSYVKPLIYTANPYIDSYAALEPGIGVRCNGVDEVGQAIRQVVKTHSPQTYRAAQEAILRLRERFTPQSQAARIARALDWPG